MDELLFYVLFPANMQLNRCSEIYEGLEVKRRVCIGMEVTHRQTEFLWQIERCSLHQFVVSGAGLMLTLCQPCHYLQ
ncbi:hypothetical protein XENTR_v10014756 [Xenopus tropicalis]|nr:hypothetical protein XENTR_v10014756 [Xenopus tropicalis]